MIKRLLTLQTRREGQQGQAIVLFALVFLIIMGMGAVTIDGGYGLVQQRRDQNGADFGAQAGTKSLAGLCSGRSIPANGAVYREVSAVINLNSPGVTNWTAFYLSASGAYIPAGSSPAAGTATKVDQTSTTPVNACGVEVDLDSTFNTYVANVLGSSKLTTGAAARSVNVPTVGGGIGIVAMDEVNPHQILGGGKGTFQVWGTIFANSAVPYDPWGQNRQWCQGLSSGCPTPRYVDVVDAKQGSSLILHGFMQTVTDNLPFDWCFGADRNGIDNGGPPNADKGSNPTPDPFNTAHCSGGNSVLLQYDKIVTGNKQRTDPLLPGGGQAGVDDPFQTVVQNPVGAGWTEGLCPNEGSPTPQTVPKPNALGLVTLTPGVYDKAVILTGAVSVHLNDCGNGYPGVYRFRGGLDLRPDATHSVTGDNVLIATSAPLPEPGNVVGVVDNKTGLFTATGPGNGAPCWPQSPGTIYNENGGKETNGDLTHQCPGTGSGTMCLTATQPCPAMPNGPYYGLITYNMTNYSTPDINTYGTGTNFSLILGGQGPITLSGPTSGVFHGVELFQDRQTEGNFGLNAEPGDTSIQNIYGVAYNGSDPCYGYPKYNGACTNGDSASPMYYKTRVPNNPNNFFDTGTPFKKGGVMQAGYGMGAVGNPTTGPFPNQSGGKVTVWGPCVVADFNTDGSTEINIDGRPNAIFTTPYQLPGIAPSGNPRIIG